MKPLDKNTFGDSKAELVLAALLTEADDINAVRYVSRFLVQLTNHMKHTLISNDGTRKFVYDLLRKHAMNEINNSKLAQVHGIDSKLVTYFKNCVNKRLSRFLKGQL